MNRVMAVYDVDKVYAERFADFINEKGKIPFSVIAFTSIEKLKEYISLNKVEILLINAASITEELESLPVGKVVRLSDGEAVPTETKHSYVYKYQAADSLIREVISCYGEEVQSEQIDGINKRSSVMGVYSPVGRCLKTSFSLTLGQLLSRDNKVLYLNFEKYSGFSKLMNEEFNMDLADIMYFYKQGNWNCLQLNRAVYTIGNLDYIPPVRCPEDMQQISPEELAEFTKLLASGSQYEIIILDLGEIGKRVTELLKICDVVYMPVKDDCVSAAKVEEFEEYLQAIGEDKLCAGIQKLKLPYYSNFGRRENYIEQLLWGELGDYVRKLMRYR